MEKTTYRKDVGRAQLVMEAPEEYGENYRYPMLAFNEPAGCLPVHECFDGMQRCYHYDVTGACSLESMMMRSKFDKALAKRLIEDLVNALGEAVEFMLDGSDFSLKPEHIYYKKEHFNFCYIPFKKSGFEEEFAVLAAYITEHGDDDDAAMIAFSAKLYKLAMEKRADYLTLSELLEEDGEESPETAHKSEREEAEDCDADRIAAKDEFPLWGDLLEDEEKAKKGDSWGNWIHFLEENE